MSFAILLSDAMNVMSFKGIQLLRTGGGEGRSCQFSIKPAQEGKLLFLANF